MGAYRFSGEYVFQVMFDRSKIEIPCTEFRLNDVKSTFDNPISISMYGTYIEEYFDFWRRMIMSYQLSRIKVNVYECDVLMCVFDYIAISGLFGSRVDFSAKMCQPNILPSSRILAENINDNSSKLDIMKMSEMAVMEEHLKDSIMAMQNADHIVSIKEDTLNNFIKQFPVAVNYTPNFSPIVPPTENDKIFMLKPTI